MPIPDGLAFSSDDRSDVTPKSSIPDGLSYTPTMPPTQPVHEFNQTTTSDYLNSLTSGLHGIGSTGASLASQMTSSPEISNWWMAQAQRQREDSAANINQMSPAAQESINAPVTSPDFWQHPFRAVALQGVQQAPALLAMALPALATGGIGGAVAGGVGETVGAMAGSAGAMSAINAGQAIDHFADVINQTPDAELRKNDDYALLRGGMSEQDAKNRFIQMRLDSSGLTKQAAMIGAVAGSIGFPAQFGAGPVADAITKRVLMGGVEGAISLGAQSGATEAVENIAQGQTPDAGSILKNSLGSAATGALLGGFGGLSRKADTPSGSRVAPYAEAQPGINNSVGSSRDGGKLGIGQNGGKSNAFGRSESAQKSPSAPPSPVNDDQLAALTANTPKSKIPDQTVEQPKVVQPTEPVAQTTKEAPPAPDTTGQLPPPPPSPESQPAPRAATPEPIPTPEGDETLQAQRAALADPNNPREAIVYPKGTQPLDMPMKKGRFGQAQLQDGRTIQYDRYGVSKLNKEKIAFADQNNRLNEILQLGPVDKGEAIDRANAGEPPVAVTERTPEGTEVKSAAGTEQTAPAQVQALEATKTPGNIVKPEQPQQVVADRLKAQQAAKVGRVLPDVSDEGKQATMLAEHEAMRQTVAQQLRDKQAQATPEGKHWTKAEQVKQAGNNLAADEIAAKHTPKQRGEGVNEIYERANDMLDEAKARGVRIPSDFKDGSNHSPGVTLLAEAKALTANKFPKPEDYARFIDREGLIRSGRHGEALSARRSEGGETGAMGAPEEHDIADTGQLTPEEHLEEKQEELSNEPSQSYTAGTQRSGFRVEKRQTVGDKLKAKRAEINTTPTEAQKKAGNYSKGHLFLGGHNITLETPKGGLREGVTPEGKEWSVEMPHDYGYIRGSEGADGDHIDVVVNPVLNRDVLPSDKIFVMNQRDPKSGWFDEHKAFIGFDKPEDALVHYQDGFVEPQSVTGRRMGGIVEMTNDDFKQWLDHGDKGQPVFDGPNGQQLDGNVTSSDNKGNIINFHPLEPKQRLSDVLDKLPKNPIIDKIKELLPDLPVYVASEEDMKKMSGVDNSLGYYHSQFNHIILNDRVEAMDQLAHVVTHEAVHAATIHGMQSNPPLYNLGMRLMDSARAQGVNDKTYAFTNPYEFVAEALSNPKFQEALKDTIISRDLAEQLGMAKWKQNTAWGGFINFIRNMFGLPEKSYSILEAAASIGERATTAHDPYEAIRLNQKLIDPSEDRDFPRQYRMHAIRQVEDNPESYSREYTRGIDKVTTRVADTLRNSRADIGANGTKFGIRISSGTQLLDMFGKHFQKDGANPMRDLVDARNRTGMRFQSIREPGQGLERESILLSKKYEGPDWQNYSELKNLSSTYGVHPDDELGKGNNAHIPEAGKRPAHDESMETWQARAHYDEIRSLYNRLPEDLKSFYSKERDFYRERHSDMAAARLKVVLDLYDAPSGRTPADILKAATTGKLSDDILDHYENLGVRKEIEDAQSIGKQKGPYFPAAREGDYVVHGQYEVPGGGSSDRGYNGEALPDNVREFAGRDEAHSFVRSLELPARTRTVYYDPITKERTTKGNVQTYQGQNLSPIERHLVTVENNHVEMANSMSEAKQQREAMFKAGVKDVTNVLDRRDRETNNQISSAQTRALIARIERRDDISPQEKRLQQEVIRQTNLANQTGNRISKHWIERRNVAGADFESVQGLRDYNNASSAYLARVETLPTIDKALEQMQEIAKQGEKGKDAFTLSTLYNEMAQRTQGFDANTLTGGKMSPTMGKVMTLNFLRYLASPAHILLHMMHPMLYTAPTLASKHGYATSYRAMAKAYSDIGGVFPALMQGLQSGSRIVRAPYLQDLDKALDWGKGANFLDTLTKGIVNTREKGLFNALSDTGHVHPSNGFTADTYSGVGLDRANRFMREITGASETINRTASALAAYRLEYNRTLSHDAAILYAKQTLEQTQGMFSSTNSAPFTRIGWMRPFLQFRQFPMQIAYILGRNAYNIFKGDSPEVKHQAMMALGGVLGTAGLLSGVGGMPTELLKVSAVLGNALGVTYSPEEYQDQMRRSLADEMGPKMANVVFEGLPSLMGPLAPSWAHRVGTGSLFTFGSPSSGSADDLQSWVLSSIFGTPGALAVDTLKGIQATEQGDYVGAVKYFAPAKIIADAARAYQEVEQGKTTKGGQEITPPLGVSSGLMQLFGLMPEESVRASEGRSAMYLANKRESTDKTSVLHQATQGDHAAALRAIQQWNQAHPDDRLTASQVAVARNAAQSKSVLGNKVTPKSKATLEDYQNAYGAN